jgi:hypothetical protein
MSNWLSMLRRRSVHSLLGSRLLGIEAGGEDGEYGYLVVLKATSA